jgi:hypothetical protein
MAFWMFFASAIGGPFVDAQILDRVLAVVDGRPITQSDLAAAIRLRLVSPAPTGDAEAQVLERLIERHLMLAEVERYAPPEPADTEVDKRLADIERQAGAQLPQVLQQTGIGLDSLRRYVRDDLRIEAYLQQRFGAVLPSEQEILQYYRDHAAEFSQSTFDQVHDRARSSLVAERRAGLIGEWVAGLRRRANINVLPR